MSRRTLHSFLRFLFGFGSFLNAVAFPVLLKTSPDKIPPFLKDYLVGIQGNIYWLWPITFVLTILVKWTDRRFCDKWGYDAVKEMLEILREQGFPNNEEPVHYHRVTLFRHRKWCFCFRRWPWRGWLVPVVRSGYTTLNHRTCFLAPDDADLAEGVAGRCWSTKSIILIPKDGDPTELPTLENKGNKPINERAIADQYAKATFVSVDWVLKKRPNARSFLGIPVVVDGEPWGVIIVDSRGTTIENAQEIRKAYDGIARPFIKCLERLP